MLTTTSEQRRKYIREAYTLERVPGGWRATWKHPTLGRAFEAASYDEVRGLARCHWGHFNFADEAQEFDAIYPRAAPSA